MNLKIFKLLSNSERERERESRGFAKKHIHKLRKMEHALKKEMEGIDDLTKVTLKALRKKVRFKKISRKNVFSISLHADWNTHRYPRELERRWIRVSSRHCFRG